MLCHHKRSNNFSFASKDFVLLQMYIIKWLSKVFNRHFKKSWLLLRVFKFLNNAEKQSNSYQTYIIYKYQILLIIANIERGKLSIFDNVIEWFYNKIFIAVP